MTTLVVFEKLNIFFFIAVFESCLNDYVSCVGTT